MTGQVTRALAEWRAGDAHAAERLVPLFYDELRGLARGHLARESPGHTLSATGLVHEVYLRLLRQRRIDAGERERFLAIAAATMRRILVDHARRRRRLKRGGPDRPVSLDPDDPLALLSPREVDEVLAMDRALDRLERLDKRARQVVECRIFGGLGLEETARVLELSTRTVQRSFEAARAWLRKEVGPGPAEK
jgi:RNA polymerase sigma factor (TIGR02999 family)